MKILSFLLVLGAVIFFLCKPLNPFEAQMFDFHDVTQPARVQQFTLNLQHGVVPPRLAPNMSFKLGYPVFNFYAPFAYWVTSLLHLTGLSIVTSLKLSFLLAILTAFTAMYFLLRTYFSHFIALLGAALYVSSPYLAVEIFIRGNISEVWYLALLPLSLLLLHKNSGGKSKVVFIITAVIISWSLTVHNIFSLLQLPLLIAYSILLPNRLKNMSALFFGLLMSAYFLVPAVMESSLTYAQTIAKNTNFRDHFLCWWQLWKATIWGYGGSAPGCTDDGLSFMLGKSQIILAVFGVVGYVGYLRQNTHRNLTPTSLFLLAITAVSLFLTTYSSQFIWELLSPIFALFQFPWRFLVYGMFGLSLAACFSFTLPIIRKLSFVALLLAVVIVFNNSKFFTKHQFTEAKFTNDHLSSMFVEHMAAYKVPEYLPKTVSYKEWLTYEPQSDQSELEDPYLMNFKPIYSLDSQTLTTTTNTPFRKEATTTANRVLLNIHYFPYWKIAVDGKAIVPTKFDSLGRPLISLEPQKEKRIAIWYQQTPIEQVGNMMSVVSIIAMLLLISHKQLWKKLS